MTSISERLRINGEEKNDYCPWAVKTEAADVIDALVAALRYARGAVNDNEEFDDVAAHIDAALAKARGEL